MSLMRRTRLLATAAVSATLAVGGLTFAPSSPADAATSSQGASYTCTNATGTMVTVPATIGLSNLPDTLATGITVSDAGYTVGLNSSALSTLLGTTNAAVNNVSTQIGATPVTNATTNPLLTALASALDFSGTLGSFTVPSSGALPLPASFNLVGTLLGLPLLSNVLGTCTLDPGSTSAVTVVTSGGTTTTGAGAISKQKSVIKARQVGRSMKVLVKVKNQTGKATGKVIAKLHNKKVGKGTLKAGKVRMKLKKLRHGLNKVKLYYQGDAISLATHKVVRVKILH